MDLETFITTVYVLVDDWYKAQMTEAMRRKSGRKPRMSDSEVITLVVAGQWDSTVGYGAGDWFWGDHLLMSVTRSRVITGWLIGAAHINDRWLMEVL